MDGKRKRVRVALAAYKALEQDLAQFAIEAHGGLERWKKSTTLSAHLIQGGVLWAVKGKAGVLDDVSGRPFRGRTIGCLSRPG